MTSRQRSQARLTRAGLDRWVRRVVPYVPGFGIVHHHGRRSGRPYQTPADGPLGTSGALGGVARVTGWACLLVGVGHLAGGAATVPGEAGTDATVDSRERFYGAVFAGYGAAWWWAARQRPIPAPLIRWLAAIMFLGGLGRLLSRATRGRPHGFQDVLTFVELTLPAVFALLVGRGTDPGRPSPRP